jgi:hypothetical protein
MLDRVFQKSPEHQGRNHRGAQIRRDADGHGESIAHPVLEDFQEGTRRLDLAPQRNLLRAVPLQRAAQSNPPVVTAMYAPGRMSPMEPNVRPNITLTKPARMNEYATPPSTVAAKKAAMRTLAVELRVLLSAHTMRSRIGSAAVKFRPHHSNNAPRARGLIPNLAKDPDTGGSDWATQMMATTNSLAGVSPRRKETPKGAWSRSLRTKAVQRSRQFMGICMSRRAAGRARRHCERSDRIRAPHPRATESPTAPRNPPA